MKQYKIIVFSKELESFEMQITAHENILFSDLHQGIQSALEYDPLQMASFFMSDEEWNKEEEISLIDMEEKGNSLLMDELKLSEKLLEAGQKMLYLYDFFSERVFYMSVDKISETDEKIFSIDIEGEIPMQINIDNEGIDDLMQNIGGSTQQSARDEYDDEYGDDFGDQGISFENIDDLENF